MSENLSFTELLISRNILPRNECAQLLAGFRGDNFALLLHLADAMPYRRDELGRLWGDSLGCAYADLDRTIVQLHWLEKLPAGFARDHLVIPLYEMGGTVTFAAARPEDPEVLRDLHNVLNCLASLVFAFPDQIEATLEIATQTKEGLLEAISESRIGELSARKGDISLAELKALTGDEAVISFTRGIIFLALRQHASDIHIEPAEFGARVRFRIDGVLREILSLESSAVKPVVFRLKIMAGIDISETAKAHDGRIGLPVGRRTVDLRFSSVPTLYGEKVVLRILSRAESRAIPMLEDLQFSQRVDGAVREIFHSPNGIFFITGPTGSGKTTSLYAMLRELNQPGVNIMTVEDPVEYRLPGINQLQVNAAKDVSFASALRAFLRQDPDIILVGEVRDHETARTAMHAALTGHLVLSTMHTNGAPEAITRLLDLGIEPYLLAPAVMGVMGQRLVRRLCDHCKVQYEPDSMTLDRIFEHDGRTQVYAYRPAGCDHCDHIGYRGRLAIHEILLVNDSVRRAIMEGADTPEIRNHLGPEYAPLRYDGLIKVLQGYTTLDEIERVSVDVQ